MTFFYKLFLRIVLKIKIGPGARLIGRPFIRNGGRGSVIAIGRNLMAISKNAANPIGVFQKVTIRTVANEAEIIIGDDVGMSGCVISAAKSIRIGSRVKIGSGVLVVDSDFHALDVVERAKGGLNGISAPVRIGDDVFIGARAIILKGVTIGKGAVVGAGAVVARDVPAGKTVVGNPAKEVR